MAAESERALQVFLEVTWPRRTLGASRRGPLLLGCPANPFTLAHARRIVHAHIQRETVPCSLPHCPRHTCHPLEDSVSPCMKQDLGCLCDSPRLRGCMHCCVLLLASPPFTSLFAPPSFLVYVAGSLLLSPPTGGRFLLGGLGLLCSFLGPETLSQCLRQTK